jgi:hypothetical protein
MATASEVKPRPLDLDPRCGHGVDVALSKHDI